MIKFSKVKLDKTDRNFLTLALALAQYSKRISGQALRIGD